MTADPLADDELRIAFQELLAAERRLRGRDSHAKDGVTLAHIKLLRPLAEAGGELPSGELARAVEVTPATMSGLLEGLERRGIVERVPHASDRRKVMVRLTETGRTKVEARRAVFVERWKDVVAGFTEDDLAAGVRLLHRLREFLDRIEPERDP